MIDIWFGYIDYVKIIYIISILVMFPLQLFLCFRMNKANLKLIPIFILIAITILFSIILQIQGRDGSVYLMFVIFSGILLVACIFAWILWFIVILLKKYIIK